MSSETRSQRSVGSAANAERVFERVILRLVKGSPERAAIAAGEVDAVLDSRTGSAILLPVAQRSLIAQDSPNRRARATLDALASHVGIVDADGVVLFANKACRAFSTSRDGLAAGMREGANYLAACDGAGESEQLDGLAIAAGLRQVIAGEREVFRYELAGTSASGRFWLMLTITGVAEDAAARAVIACEDITELKRTERLLALECRIARTLAASESTSSAVTSVIRAVCESQGWECGRFFRLDPASGVLSCVECWGVETSAVEEFLTKSRGMRLRLGAGLKGRVCLSGQPLWVLDGTRGAAVSPIALAPETDTDAAFVIPVTAQARTIGVIAFSNRAFSEPDDRILQAARSLGSQLGQFLERQDATDRLRRSEARFRKATELSSDWYWEQDSQFRFTQFAGCGITGVDDYLGKTHWELANIQMSEAQWAEHRSHLAAHWSFCDFEFAAMQPDGQLGYYSISGEPVYDEAGTFTGYCGTGLDITHRKRAESALRESEARLRTLAGLAPD